jgi:hypothetical protein
LKKDGLKEEEQEPDADHFPGNHHEKMGPVGHLLYETDFEE